MISKVKIIGLQRSGTNYLEELIRKNFEVFVYDHPLYPFFKHAGPQDRTLLLDNGEKLYTEPPVRCLPFYHVLYIVIEKNVNKWMYSVKRSNTNLLLKHPEIFEGNVLHMQKAREFHTSYYNAWKALNYPNLFHVTYEDLITDFSAVLQMLKVNFFLDRRQELRTFIDTDVNEPRK